MSMTHPRRPKRPSRSQRIRVRAGGLPISERDFNPVKAVAATLCTLLLMLPYAVEAQKPQTKEKLDAGRTLFVKNCSPCHGANGQGGEGPSLQKLTMTDATIATTIKNGIKGEMPAFGSKFKDADIKALTLFLHSIKK